MKNILLGSIKIYKNIFSPLLRSLFGGGCRYTPTCSEYSYDAIEKHGIYKGLSLSIKRIGKCHPFSSGGFDPVPKKV